MGYLDRLDILKEEATPCQAWLKSLDHSPSDEEVHSYADKNGKERLNNLMEDVVSKVDSYKGFDINKDNTVKQSKYYAVVNHKVLYGSSIDIVKKKVDRLTKEAFMEGATVNDIKKHVDRIVKSNPNSRVRAVFAFGEVNIMVSYTGGKGIGSMGSKSVLGITYKNMETGKSVAKQLNTYIKSKYESFKEIQEPIPEDQADPEELKKGIQVELEHTDNRDEAKLIALQHLAEVPDYYTKLKKHVEEEGCTTGNNAGAIRTKMANKENYMEKLDRLIEGFEVGDRVKSGRDKGKILKVYSDGSADIKWLDNSQTRVNLNNISKESILNRLDNLKESLSPDENDVLEGIVLRNKRKSDDELFRLVKKDSMFKGVSDRDIKQAIKDTKKVYKIESVSDKDKNQIKVLMKSLGFDRMSKEVDKATEPQLKKMVSNALNDMENRVNKLTDENKKNTFRKRLDSLKKQAKNLNLV